VSSKKMGLRRVGIVGLSTLLATTMMSSVASANSTFAFTRLAGVDRYATSVATAVQFGASTDVILASGEAGHYPDALTASYLAGAKHAPILLTQAAATPANIATQIAASGATHVWIIGGTTAISAAQAATLGSTYTVTRLGGADRYATAAQVMGAVTATGTMAILATGENFPDALGGGALSYAKGMPLAITQSNTLTPSTLAALKASGTTSVLVLGGVFAISQGVVDSLAANGITLSQRFAGATRSGTSTQLANYEITSQGFSATAVNVASGYNPGGGVDALGGAALSGQENRPLLITDSNSSEGADVDAFLVNHAPTLASGFIFGGIFAVSQAVQDSMTAAATTVAATGAIVMPSTTVVQGGTLTGTVVNPTLVSNVAVVGCGITNTNVTVSGTGAFSLLVPASQVAGPCNLVFTVTKTDSTILTQTVAITVTAIPRGVTAGPDLISVAITGNNVVYTFDEPLNVVATGLNPASFHIYLADGTEINPAQITSGGSAVTARYLPGDLALATTATVDQAAVQDASLRPNPINALPLQTITLPIGKSAAPNLVSVGNPGVVLGNITFDFTFDAPIVTPLFTANQFCVVSVDGITYCGGGTPTYNVGKTVVTVPFSSLTLASVPASQVVRGSVETNTVTDTSGDINPLQTANVGVTRATTAPDLMSVTVVATDTVRYIFDQPVNAAGANAGGFRVFDASGTFGSESFGTGAAPVNANANAVDVTFPAGKVGNAVGASVQANSIQGTTGTLAGNANDELGLQSVIYVAGRTATPDLVSVTKSTDVFNVTRVVYTFSSPLPGLPVSSSFFLYDPTGAQFPGGGGVPTLSNGNMTVTITNGFTPAQIAAATIGAVDANPGPDVTPVLPVFPEGAANAIG
jgi:putative cell wall-binding protein